MNFLVLNSKILAVDPQDHGDKFVTSDQIIEKSIISGYALIKASELPEDYAPGRYDYVDGFVLSEKGLADDAAAKEAVNTEYQRLRAAEYPPMSDYMDGIVKGDQKQVQTYIDACLAVKAKYPKPE